MVQKIRYFKTDSAENDVSAEQLRSCKHELEVEPCAAPGRQQGLALLLSLQDTPQLKGHSLGKHVTKRVIMEHIPTVSATLLKP